MYFPVFFTTPLYTTKLQCEGMFLYHRIFNVGFGLLLWEFWPEAAPVYLRLRFLTDLKVTSSGVGRPLQSFEVKPFHLPTPVPQVMRGVFEATTITSPLNNEFGEHTQDPHCLWAVGGTQTFM